MVEKGLVYDENDNPIRLNKERNITRANVSYDKLGRIFAYIDTSVDSISGEVNVSSRSDIIYNEIGQTTGYNDSVRNFVYENGSFLHDVRNTTLRSNIVYDDLGRTLGYLERVWNEETSLMDRYNTRSNISYDEFGRVLSYVDKTFSSSAIDVLDTTYVYGISYDDFGNQKSYIELNNKESIIKDSNGNSLYKLFSYTIYKDIKYDEYGRKIFYNAQKASSDAPDVTSDVVWSVISFDEKTGRITGFKENINKTGIDNTGKKILDVQIETIRTGIVYDSAGQVLRYTDTKKDSSL